MVDQPSFRETILAFLRRKTLFLLAFSAVCLVGGVYLLLKQPLYQSGASLVLHFDRKTVPNIDRTMNRPTSSRAPTSIARFCIPTPTSCAARI